MNYFIVSLYGVVIFSLKLIFYNHVIAVWYFLSIVFHHSADFYSITCVQRAVNRLHTIFPDFAVNTVIGWCLRHLSYWTTIRNNIMAVWADTRTIDKRTNADLMISTSKRYP